jgi:hypothetical protein
MVGENDWLIRGLAHSSDLALESGQTEKMNAIVAFQGFTESDNSRTGTEDLFFRVIRCYASPTVTTYHPRTWTSNVKRIAAQLSRQGIRNVAMVSYSHGQAAATDFANACYTHGISVDLWLACDPVYRPTWLPRVNWLQPAAIRALCQSAIIKVPHNVMRVVSVRQELSIPKGHLLRSTSSNTRIEQSKVLRYTHTTIDQSPEWFTLVARELAHWVSPRKAKPIEEL